jgi:nucleoside-triphosphatase THEP1
MPYLGTGPMFAKDIGWDIFTITTKEVNYFCCNCFTNSMVGKLIVPLEKA